MKSVEIMVPGESRVEVERILALLSVLSDDEKRDMLAFMKGVEFGRRLGVSTDPAA